MNPRTVRAAFDLVGVTLQLPAIHPIRQVKPTDLAWGKYGRFWRPSGKSGSLSHWLCIRKRESEAPIFSWMGI